MQQLQTLRRCVRLQLTQPQTTALGVCNNSCSCTMVWRFGGFCTVCYTHSDFCMLMMQADCIHIKICLNGWYMAMVSFHICSCMQAHNMTDLGTCCCISFSQCSDSKHPQADAAYFHRREFCFTLDGDIFVRYQSFKARSVALLQCHCAILPCIP